MELERKEDEKGYAREQKTRCEKVGRKRRHERGARELDKMEVDDDERKKSRRRSLKEGEKGIWRNEVLAQANVGCEKEDETKVQKVRTEGCRTRVYQAERRGTIDRSAPSPVLDSSFSPNTLLLIPLPPCFTSPASEIVARMSSIRRSVRDPSLLSVRIDLEEMNVLRRGSPGERRRGKGGGIWVLIEVKRRVEGLKMLEGEALLLLGRRRVVVGVVRGLYVLRVRNVGLLVLLLVVRGVDAVLLSSFSCASFFSRRARRSGLDTTALLANLFLLSSSLTLPPLHIHSFPPWLSQTKTDHRPLRCTRRLPSASLLLLLLIGVGEGRIVRREMRGRRKVRHRRCRMGVVGGSDRGGRGGSVGKDSGLMGYWIDEGRNGRDRW
jgi:hypothetical protein